MIPRIVGACLFACLFAPSPVGADESAARWPFQLLGESVERNAPTNPPPPVFGGLGTRDRNWEIVVSSGFSTNRTATERLAIGGYYGLLGTRLGLVVRSDFGIAADAAAAFYTVEGPRLSLGLRLQSSTADEAMEFGVRVLFPWTDRQSKDPEFLRLALAATLNSAQADDARWLSFASTGYQVYLFIEQQVEVSLGGRGVLIPGARYGGQTSFTPLTVNTWLGPQQGIVANAFLEAYLGVPWLALPLHRYTDLRVEFGLRGEASLSSIWPGDAALPLALEGFVDWSPKTWISARAFYGVAVPATELGGGTLQSNPYGVRVTFYVP